jgi:endonuclease/exonuclease/phosphatase family metal-dependent hydrolase
MSRLRVMSYNVHGCRGLDGRVTPSRVADVIASLEPDVVALQELFIHDRDGDQLALIADRLQMTGSFCETLETPRGRYGHAVLSRHPVHEISHAQLPGLAIAEPRSALLATVNTPAAPLRVLATHLSLEPLERRQQVRRLAHEWQEDQGPFVLAGDLNLRPGSSAHQKLSESLRDAWVAQRRRPGRRPPTWPSLLPIFTFDYVFVSRDITVDAAFIPGGGSVALASDHRPVVADLLL